MYFTQWTDDLISGFDGLLCKTHDVHASRQTCFDLAKKFFLEVRHTSKKIVIVGNGGSSSVASHISQDIINKLKISSLVITDASLITCIGNDAGYENIFSQPLNVLLNEHDLLIAISDSGESANILNSVRIAKQKNCKIIALSAFKTSNSLHNASTHISIHIPTVNYSIAEVAHLAILHVWVDELAGVQTKNASESTYPIGISA